MLHHAGDATLATVASGQLRLANLVWPSQVDQASLAGRGINATGPDPGATESGPGGAVRGPGRLAFGRAHLRESP
jgi:hypothetical protein